GLVSRRPDLPGMLNLIAQSNDSVLGRGQELIGLVELAFLERGNSLGEAKLRDLGQFSTVASPGAQCDRRQNEQNDAGKNQERQRERGSARSPQLSLS